MNPLKVKKDAVLVPVPVWAQEINTSCSTARRIAEQANALYKIGRSVRVDRATGLKYLRDNYRAGR